MPPHPRILLHGFAGSPASWDAFRETLAGPSLALPLPGHAPGLDVAETFEANADAVAARIADAGSPAHVVGYSLGARVALGVLARRPAVVASLTLISVNPGLRTEAERRDRRAWDLRWAELLRREGIAAFVEQWERLPLFASQRALPAPVRQRQRAIRLFHDPEQLARSLEQMGLSAMPDYWPLLKDTTTPVRLLAGQHDGKFRALGEAVAATSDRITLEVIPGCGHNPLISGACIRV